MGLPWHAPRPGRVGRTRAKHLAPRVAPAAVRIPDPRLAPLDLSFAAVGPQIFIHEGARQALERRFEAAAGGPVQLAVTDNLHRMISYTRSRGTLKVRLHMMFLGASERVLDAMVRYVVRDDRAASAVVGEFIQANTHRIRAWRPVRGVRTAGQHHDLLTVLADVNDRYFGSALGDVLVTWGRRARPRTGTARRTIKLGSYSVSERLVRVHPVLDQPWVPRYFLSYIVYHELLHHVVPGATVRSRFSLHTAEFARREREFRHYERAIEWERRHIDRLLRAR
ncbi:MAG: hypothetical protein IT376_07515 [Polyangiaceae bacterium]|nr:hypothetical protein [Polyangiaceae bacterium]